MIRDHEENIVHLRPYLRGLSLHTSELAFRVTDQFNLKQQRWRDGVDGLVANFYYIVDRKGVPVGVCGEDIKYTMRGIWSPRATIFALHSD